MAIQVSGTQVIGNSRELTNIASVDATTAASITAAGVGGGGGAAPFPDWANPDSTITGTSGTYTKPGSVGDDDYMWVFVVGSGGAGQSSGRGGSGGNPMALYGKAGDFDGFTYSIPSGNSYGGSQNAPNATVTLATSKGGAVFSTSDRSISTFFEQVQASVTDSASLVVSNAGGTVTWSAPGSPPSGAYQLPNTSGTEWLAGIGNSTGGNEPSNGYFGGGGGGGVYSGSTRTRGGSQWAGDGAQSSGSIAAEVPGGGGAGSTNSTLGKGADGNIRIYYL